jgi:plastocyanin
LSFTACSSSRKAEDQQATNSQPKQTVTVDPATAANVSGVVKFEGAVPKAQQIDMAQDPGCGSKPNSDESVTVANGGLSNVFVYVKEGLGNSAFAVPTAPVVIEQQGCRYHPHVLGAMVGQTVKIVNDDETTHNIHPMPASNKQWNESQLPKAAPIEKTFKQAELMIPVKCNQHPWMKMYLNVVGNPFFAVTGSDGKFEIKGLPPGEYEIAAVHEKLGEQDVKISVGPKQSKAAAFTFKAQ